MSQSTTKRKQPRFSLQGKILAASGLAMALAICMALLLEQLGLPFVPSAAAALIAGIALLSIVVRQLVNPLNARIGALIDSADSLRDADFSFTIADDSNDEVGELVRAYNLTVGTLREERQNLHQRELMLDTVIQASPLALVLCSDDDRVIYANASARGLFSDGRPFAGQQFLVDIATQQPAALQEALVAGQDALVSFEEGQGAERYHLSCNDFTLNARQHRLYLLKRLTNELNRQEVATWKKVIRLIGHELNNSLAPISSLAHSGQLLAERNDTEAVSKLLKTIEVRSGHLKHFIEGYSRFAKLPTPAPQQVSWEGFLSRVRALQPFALHLSDSAAKAWFDPEQMEQVLINLVKNAHESGSDPEDVQVSVSRQRDGWHLTVQDRGKGMSEEALVNALIPFYSTKKSGSGLGLSLCREIVDAHGGRISLQNRPKGGLTVGLFLPDPGQ
ncbi:MAG: ATP-binding protein [Pseudomonadota bacterium]